MQLAEVNECLNQDLQDWEFDNIDTSSIRVFCVFRVFRVSDKIWGGVSSVLRENPFSFRVFSDSDKIFVKVV